MNKNELIDMLTKGRLIGVMRNLNRYIEHLRTRPYYEFLDLALTYEIVIKEDSARLLHAAVTNDVMDLLGWDPDELYTRVVNSLESELNILKYSDLLPWSPIIALLPSCVVTNTYFSYGATQILNMKAFEKLSEEFDDDLIILPCSIDELIIVPASCEVMRGIDGDDLFSIIKHVNMAILDTSKILSYHPYYYNRVEKRIYSIIK